MTTTDGNTQAQTEQPAPSAPESGNSSQEVKITKAEWDRVTSALGRIPDLQSGRDIAQQARKEISGLRDDIRPLLERAHALGSQNKPLGEALNQIQSEQTDAEFREAVLTIARGMRGGTQPTSAGNAQGVDMAAVLADYQLDPKDSFVAGRLAGQTFTSKEQAELFAARIFRDKALAPQTNPAQQSATTGNVPGNVDYDALAAEYSELSVNPAANMARMIEIQQELDKLK